MRAAVSIMLVFLLPLAAAWPPETCEPSTSYPEIDTGETPGGRYYWDCDLLLAGIPCWTYAYVYEESNGINGLQRDDRTHDDTCEGLIPSDTLIW